jgi:hypothetical protein
VLLTPISDDAVPVDGPKHRRCSEPTTSNVAQRSPRNSSRCLRRQPDPNYANWQKDFVNALTPRARSRQVKRNQVSRIDERAISHPIATVLTRTARCCRMKLRAQYAPKQHCGSACVEPNRPSGARQDRRVAKISAALSFESAARRLLKESHLRHQRQQSRTRCGRGPVRRADSDVIRPAKRSRFSSSNWPTRRAVSGRGQRGGTVRPGQ